ncbi:MAG: hypothetical protein U0269_02000 [Polyangiales bacterium]
MNSHRAGALVVAFVGAVLSTGCRRRHEAQPSVALSALPPVRAGQPGQWAVLRSTVDEQGEWDMAGALRAFASTFGPIEGAPPAVARDQSSPLCGLPVLRAVNRHWGALSPTQRRAVQRVVARPSNRAAAVIEVLEPIGDFDNGTRARQRVQLEQLRAMAATLQPQIERLIGRPFAGRVAVELNGPNTTPALAIGDAELGDGHLDADDWDKRVASREMCRIMVNPDFLGQSTTLRMMLAHELFHCAQMEVFAGTWREWEARPLWLSEGTAAFVGESIGGPTNADGYWWNEFFSPRVGGGRHEHTLSEQGPGAPFNLFAAGYDAIGFFVAADAVARNALQPAAGQQSSRILTVANARSNREALAQISSWHPEVLSSSIAQTMQEPSMRGWSLSSPTLQSDLPAPNRRSPHVASAPIERAPLNIVLRDGWFGLYEARAETSPLIRVRAVGSGVVAFGGDAQRRFSSATEDTFYFSRGAPFECPAGQRPNGAVVSVPSLSAPMHAALIAAGQEATLRVDVADPAMICGASRDSAPPPPECLHGRWRMDADAFRQAFRQAFAGAAQQLEIVTADETLELSENGSMRFTVASVTARGENAGITSVVSASGVVRGRATLQGGELRLTATQPPQFAGSFVVRGGGIPTLSRPLPENIRAYFTQQTTGSFRAVCDQRSLTLTPENGLAYRFVRQ